MTLQSDLQAAVSRVESDSQLLHDIIHGTYNQTVTTEGGPVKTAAKTIYDLEQTIQQGLTSLDTSSAALNAAVLSAENYRNEAQGFASAAQMSVNSLALPALSAGLGGKALIALEDGSGYGFENTPSVQGCCRLEFVSATLLKLIPHGGNSLILFDGQNWKPALIPYGGIELSNSGIAADTTYMIYAYLNGGVIALEASTTIDTEHTGAQATGYRIKSGSSADPTRLLVGMARSNASGQWQDGAFTLSYFNRRPRSNSSQLTETVNISTTGLVQISSSLVTRYLCWQDEEAHISYNGLSYTNAGAISVMMALVVDGVQLPDLFQNVRDSYSSPEAVHWATFKKHNQGFHYAYPQGAVSGAGWLATFQGYSWANSNSCRLNVTVMG